MFHLVVSCVVILVVATKSLGNRYIVTLNERTTVLKHLELMRNLTVPKGVEQDPFDSRLSHIYSIPGFEAYAGQFSNAEVEQLRTAGDIQSIIQVRPIRLDSLELHTVPEVSRQLMPRAKVTQCCAAWGLYRISHAHKGPVLSGSYVYDASAGDGTYAYVLDSGIVPNHEEFGTRASFGHNSISDEQSTDSLGHGTFVAGLIGGKTYGVAKKTKLVSVKVLRNDGTTDESLVLDGLAWAVNDIVAKKRQSKAVINLSLTTYKNEAVNKAVNAAAWENGVTIVTAAGNLNLDASQFSPGSAKSTITVSAVDKNFRRWDMANFGRNVNMFAPGVAVKSATIGGRRSYAIQSGTSFAAAYVSGLVVYGKGMMALRDPAATWRWLYNTGTKGFVVDAKGGRNLFPYNGCGS